MKSCALIAVLFFCAGCTSISSLGELRGIGDGNNPPPDRTNGELKIVFADVGQGDATLITSSKQSMLIDAGPPGAGYSVVLPMIRQEESGTLKYIVATHYHDDHIGGIPEVLKGEDHVLGTVDDVIPTDGILDRGGNYEKESPSYEEYQTAAGPRRTAARPGDIFTVGDASIEVLASGGEVEDGTSFTLGPDDENSASIVLLLTYGNFSYLHGADITGGGGDPPYQTIDIETSLAPLAGDVDVLRVAHHGSDTSTNAGFLEAIDPEAAIISVGDNNDYGHPASSVINRLLEDDVEIYQTEQGWLDERFDDEVNVMDDNITLTTDGQDWHIE